jgi:hypothetical protein
LSRDNRITQFYFLAFMAPALAILCLPALLFSQINTNLLCSRFF